MELAKDVDRKRKLERTRFATQLYFIELRYSEQLSLLRGGEDGDDDSELLHRTALACVRKLLTPKQWNEIAVERSAVGRCGWPMCNEGLPSHPPISATIETKALVRIDDEAVIKSRSLGHISGNVHAVDLYEYTNYCSNKCYVRSVAWMLKLSEEHIMMRKVNFDQFARIVQFLDNTGVQTPYDNLPEIAMQFLKKHEEQIRMNRQSHPADKRGDETTNKVAANQLMSKNIREKNRPEVVKSPALISNSQHGPSSGTNRRRPVIGSKLSTFTYDDECDEGLEKLLTGPIKEKMTDSMTSLVADVTEPTVPANVPVSEISIDEASNNNTTTPCVIIDPQQLEVAHINDWYDHAIEDHNIDENTSSDCFMNDYIQNDLNGDDNDGGGGDCTSVRKTTRKRMDLENIVVEEGVQRRPPPATKSYWENLLDKYSSVLSDNEE